MMINKTLVFDMDGTIADLYAVENWLPMLRSEDSTPYRVARPMYEMAELAELLNLLKGEGWKIVVTSWSSKQASREYDKRVRAAKVAWLKKYGFPADEIHVVKYGKSKSEVTKDLGGFQILVDDNEEVRMEWSNGETIDATENILEELRKLMERAQPSPIWRIMVIAICLMVIVPIIYATNKIEKTY